MCQRLLCVMSAVMAGLGVASCGSPVANLTISTPSSAVAGSPFAVTVTAMVDGRRDTIFNSPVHLSSSDSAAVLPIDYAFTAADKGSHTFSNVILMTVGTQSIKVTDKIAHSLNATTNVAVSAATTGRQ